MGEDDICQDEKQLDSALALATASASPTSCAGRATSASTPPPSSDPLGSGATFPLWGRATRAVVKGVMGQPLTARGE
jgi:hypothetical protein